MDFTELLIKESVLPSALANAALLIAAPSLGCLNVYTKAFTDLCKAYDLNVPDLAHILLYNSMGLSSSLLSNPKTDTIQKLTQAQLPLKLQEPISKQVEIKKEPKDFEGDTFRVKHDINNNNPLYKACIYNTNSNTQVASLDKHIKNEGTKVELQMDIKLEIPSEIKDNSKVTNTKLSTQGALLEIHGKNKDRQLEASFDTKHKEKSKIQLEDNNIDHKSSFKTDYYSNFLRDTSNSLYDISNSSKIRSDSSILDPKTSVNKSIDIIGRNKSTPSSKKKLNSKNSTSSNRTSRVSLKDTQCETPFDRALHKSKNNKQNALINEGQPKISSFKKYARTDKKKSAHSHYYLSKLSDASSMSSSKSSETRSNASISCPKTSVYSILDNTGFRQYATSSEEARKKMFQCGMPMKFTDGATCSRDIKDCLIYVDTSMEGSIRTSVLCIWLKEEDRPFMIPFANIHEISQYSMFNVRVYYSTHIKSIEHINLRPQETKSYSKKINIITTINWLQTFLG